MTAHHAKDLELNDCDALELDGVGALYKQIEKAVRAEIMSGRWPAGHRIPSEHTLMETFSTTRATVNKALSKLTEAGLLERRRKQGTRVAQTTESHAVIGFLDIRKEIEDKGRLYSYRVLAADRIIAGKQTGIWPEVPAGTPLLKLSAVHLGFEKAEVVEERLINLQAAPEAAEADFEAETPSTWLLARLPCTRLRHTIRAEAAMGEHSALLDIPARSPVLVSLRQTWADELPVTWVKLIYPADRNEFVGEFNPLQP
ncbi:UTRA domain-containing protein [Mesorhizobium sp.]|uniref:UTRA domain-containing protein n=1 Tax=Mesorhizobium sp. TaxID=1871066 RepID=UPI000FE82CDF|nr:UTRA domain-containing protein [Mesorhizobium sp.]RWK43087.1 MAG: UTRA domain-containing protein [Mesorhizobium sp.]RWK67998.1 MAG: UTRA domain-containing protein [Mesorhizobium sp.]RWK73859.1 MAG: UTRA domain-containing protein [Mesorhizobium sp.]RWK81108.1 MAG: UTRA domain-containing protein [Mesorhizobium sp.]RWL08430.1 MAG: UTRA domain-containing protein [Mesorhizobium sp.]